MPAKTILTAKRRRACERIAKRKNTIAQHALTRYLERHRLTIFQVLDDETLSSIAQEVILDRIIGNRQSRRCDEHFERELREKNLKLARAM